MDRITTGARLSHFLRLLSTIVRQLCWIQTCIAGLLVISPDFIVSGIFISITMPALLLSSFLSLAALISAHLGAAPDKSVYVRHLRLSLTTFLAIFIANILIGAVGLTRFDHLSEPTGLVLRDNPRQPGVLNESHFIESYIAARNHR